MVQIEPEVYVALLSVYQSALTWSQSAEQGSDDHNRNSAILVGSVALANSVMFDHETLVAEDFSVPLVA